MNVRIGVLCAVASAAVALLPSLSLAQWAREIDSSSGDDAYSIVATSDGGYVLSAALSDGSVVALLPTDDAATLRSGDLASTGAIIIERRDADGKLLATVSTGE